MLLPSCPMYSTMEDEAIAKCLGIFGLFENSSTGATELKHSVRISRLETKQDAATGLLLGRAAAVIRAPLLEIVAHVLNADGRFVASLNAADRNLVRSEVLAIATAHHTVVFNRFKARGLADRTFLNSIIAKEVSKDPLIYVVAVVPIPSHEKIDRKDEAGAIRGENTRSFKLTAVAPDVTELEYCCSINLRGFFPQSITNTVVVPAQMSLIQTLQQFFQQIRPLGECDSEDGRLVGRLLVDANEGNAGDPGHAIRTLANQTTMLRECGFNHIGSMLTSLLSADSQGEPDDAAIASFDASTGGSSSEMLIPSSLTEKQATAIGHAIGSSVHRAHVPAMALNQVVKKHAVLQSMQSRWVWFVPMLEVVAAHKATKRRRSSRVRGVAPYDLTSDAGVVQEETSVGPEDRLADERNFSSVVRFATQKRFRLCALVDDAFVPMACSTEGSNTQVPSDGPAREAVAAPLKKNPSVVLTGAPDSA